MPDANPEASGWKIPEHVIFQVLDGEAVVLNVESGRYFGLNEVGTRFWQGLEQGHSGEQITELLLGEYDVERPELQRDLAELIAALKERNLLEEAGNLSS
ncbi:MAG: PqqD family protein [Acidobacteria bacterium]|nr:PqqD family protein [Acidobacteriota bacterium]